MLNDMNTNILTLMLAIYFIYYISFVLFLTLFYKRITLNTRLKFFYTYIAINLLPNIIIIRMIVPIFCILFNAYFYYKDIKAYSVEKTNDKKGTESQKNREEE